MPEHEIGTDPPRDAVINAALAMQEGFRDLIAGIEGTVHELVGSGWTDSQARAIVASSFGWQAPKPPEQQ